jgi:hypothetical protein
MPLPASTVYKFDWAAFRSAFLREKELREVNFTEISAQTGIYLGSFTHVFKNNRTVELDSVLTLCKWMNRNPFDFTVRKRTAFKHSDNAGQRQIRMLTAFLDSNELVNDGESAVDAVIRLLKATKDEA